MRRKTDRNNLIIEKIKKGEYQVDIAKEFHISPPRVSSIKKKLMSKVVNKSK